MDFKINDYSKEVLQAKDEAVKRFLEEAGLFLEGEAQAELENDPRRIDTGRLRNSISHAPGGEGEYVEYVGTNVEYAPYVHEGTRRMTANRFLKNAFEKNMDQIKEKLKQALGNA